MCRGAACTSGARRSIGYGSDVVLAWFWRGFGVVLEWFWGQKTTPFRDAFLRFLESQWGIFGALNGGFFASFWGGLLAFLGANNGLVLGVAMREFEGGTDGFGGFWDIPGGRPTKYPETEEKSAAVLVAEGVRERWVANAEKYAKPFSHR